MLPLGPLPKGGHGGKDHNTRTQVTVAEFKESILSFSKESRLTPFFHLEAECHTSAVMNRAEEAYVL